MAKNPYIVFLTVHGTTINLLFIEIQIEIAIEIGIFLSSRRNVHIRRLNRPIIDSPDS